MKPPPLPGTEAGFTLLELLVGLALLALLTAGLAPAMRLAGQAWDLVGRAGEAAETVQTAQGFLRHTIAEAYPASFTDADGRRTLAFAGAEDGLALVTPMPVYLGLGGLQIVRISVTEQDGRRDLLAGWTPLLTETAGLGLDRTARSVVLASGIEKLELRYYGREAAAEPPQWFSTWQGHAGLPKLISLRVTFPGGQDAWPDLLVRPMTDLGAMVNR